MHIESGHQLTACFIKKQGRRLANECRRQCSTAYKLVDHSLVKVSQTRRVYMVTKDIICLQEAMAWWNVEWAHWRHRMYMFLNQEKLAVIPMLNFNQFLIEFFCFR